MQQKKILSSVMALQLMLAALLVCMALAKVSIALAQGIGTPAAPVAENRGDYYSEVAVNGQDAAEQSSAQGVALRMILLRTSNDKTLLNKPAVRRSLVSAQDYVIESQYRLAGAQDRITRSTPITAKVRKTGEATHILGMQFDAVAINSLVAEQTEQVEADPDAPPATVPATALAWLLIDDGNAEHKIGGNTGRNVMERALEIAGGVGQGLVFPRQDSADQALTADDIRAGNQQRIAAASGRYQQAVVLAGILKRSGASGWTANWSRYYNAEVVDQSYEAGSLDQALQQGIRWLAALRSAPLAGASEQAASSAYLPSGALGSGSADEGILWMGRVATTEAYAAVLRLIEEVESVQLVYPKELIPGGILFSVSPRSAINAVTQRLSQVNWIAPATTLGGNNSAQLQSADAYYEYLR